jgi:hypothetical protein
MSRWNGSFEMLAAISTTQEAQADELVGKFCRMIDHPSKQVLPSLHQS